VTTVGMVVGEVGVGGAVEVGEVRGVVLGSACARLAGKATAEEKDSLRACVAAMDDVIKRENPSEYYRQNLRFHDLIMEYSGHFRAAQMHDSLVKESHLIRQRSLIPIPAMHESNSEHKQIVDAIVAGDAKAAHAAAE